MYYVYTLADPNGTVFYVGKSNQAKRLTNHLYEARKGWDTPKCRRIREIWAAGGKVQCTKVAWFAEEPDAFQFEQELVKRHGRENLLNETSGGAGALGRIESPETRAKKRAWHLGRPHSPEHRAALSAANKGKKPAPQTIAAGQTPEVIARRANTIAKTYPGFVAPDGTTYRDVHNLNAFAREHGLDSGSLCWLAKGRFKQHKGWTALTE